MYGIYTLRAFMEADELFFWDIGKVHNSASRWHIWDA